MAVESGSFAFELHHADAGCAARRSTFRTPHGPVEMPAFMPVGTSGSVKGLEIEQLRHTGTEMVLGNTYHLTLRPGEKVVQALGGLHRFMGWDGPILTDSGGFQLFSLAHRTKVTEQQAVFRSHIDGRLLEMSPERAVEIQEALDSDVAMVLDHVVALPNEPEVVRDATERTIRWAQRCHAAASRQDQALFAIVQGGLDLDLRADCARQLAAMDFAGYAVGGLSVGEQPADMYQVLDATVPQLPADRPRYLMGVGRPEDLLAAIARGIDLFDCVMPTRNGRNAMAFTDEGTLRLRNLKYERDTSPVQQRCPCPTCRLGRGYSRGYIRHLFMAGEMLGPILLSIHNLTYYQRLLAEGRAAIEADRFTSFFREKLRGWGGLSP
ncbi:MAG: tRNA guanosine(34) transglycosylase Tgt [Planctomycetes bacterium RBG_13_63_9]|nr:MAG: tRNA guanosine(34) transglycosylase Tgt [Planctomycetes bacterium RBG_13_63_9]